MYLSRLLNVFVQIVKCICSNCYMYLSQSDPSVSHSTQSLGPAHTPRGRKSNIWFHDVWQNMTQYIKIEIKSVLQSRRRSLKLARLIGCPTGARDGAREALSVSQTPRYIRISPFYIWQYHHNTKIPQYQDISEYYHFILEGLICT